MLTDQSKGFQKLIFERIYQIRDEILNPDPEYRERKHTGLMVINKQL